MAKLGNESKLILKLAEERVEQANIADATNDFEDSEDKVTKAKNRIYGRNDALAILKSIHLELIDG